MLNINSINNFNIQTIKDSLAFSVLSHYSLDKIYKISNERPIEERFQVLYNINYVRYFESILDAQCIIVNINYNNKDTLFIAFRGTDSKLDWLHNINITQSILPIPNTQLDSFPRIHSGFNSHFNSIRPSIQQEINHYISNTQQPHIIFTGYSIGAACASIGYLYFNYLYNQIHNINLINFASPKIGDDNYVKLMDNIKSNSIRIIRHLDPIPILPDDIFFRHAGPEFYINDHIIPMNNSTTCCSFLKNLCCFKCRNQTWVNILNEHALSKYNQDLNSFYNIYHKK